MIGEPKKAKHLNIHVKKRLFQRFGIIVNKTILRELNENIRTNKAKFLKSQSHSRTIWKLQYMGKNLYCVYNNKLHSICTVLTEEQFLERNSTNISQIETEEG